MKIYTGICYSKKLLWVYDKYNLGMMLSTTRSKGWYRKWHSKYRLALDNGAFGAYSRGELFPTSDFIRCINDCRKLEFNLDFVVCPDIVSGGIRSLDFSISWYEKLVNIHGINDTKIALAVQDGMSPSIFESLGYMDEIRKFNPIFIGGTPNWKWKTLNGWSEFAREESVSIHVGRCGTLEKLQRCNELNVTSCDSTNFVRNGVEKGDELLERFYNPIQYELF